MTLLRALAFMLQNNAVLACIGIKYYLLVFVKQKSVLLISTGELILRTHKNAVVIANHICANLAKYGMRNLVTATAFKPIKIVI
jgi:hypothetical protein